MDLLSVVAFISIVVIYGISALTLRANPSAQINRIFFTFGFLTATWALLVFFENSTKSLAWANALTRVDFCVASLVILSWGLFSWAFTHQGRLPSRTLMVILPAIGVLFAALAFTGLLIQNVRIEDAVVFDTGPAFLAFGVYVAVLGFGGFIGIGRHYFRSRGAERARAFYILIGGFLTFLVVVLTNIVYPQVFSASLAVSRLGLAGLIFLTAAAAYSTLRYRLMDVTLVLRRTVSYALILSVIVGVYALVLFFLSNSLKGFFDISERGIQIIALLILAVSILPLKWLVDRYMNRYLFHGTYDPRELMKEAENLLSLNQDLESALSSLGRRLCTAMGVAGSAFIIFSEADPGSIILDVFWKLGDVPTEYLKTSLNFMLDSTLLENRGNLVVRDELAQRIREHQAARYYSPEALLREMDALALGIAVPVSFRDEVGGMLVLCEKVNRRDFSTQDIDFLRGLSQRVAYVVDHHRLYEELKHKYEELDLAYEQLKDIDRFKSDIITITNHELRGPLTLIKGYLDLLNARMEDFDDSKRHELLALAKKGTDRLAQIVDDLRVVTDIETGRLFVDTRELDLHSMALEAELSLAVEPPVSFEYNFAADLPSVYGDREKVVVVLHNLMDNANKFAGKYGPIQVGAYAADDGVVVFVKDQGPGMRKEYLDSIFGLFSFIGDSDHHSEEGLGLGLYVARRLVEMHSGKIWGESEIDHGSSFFFLLPVREAPRPASQAWRESLPGDIDAAGGLTQGGGPNVLRNLPDGYLGLQG